jgi:hypothetical protein
MWKQSLDEYHFNENRTQELSGQKKHFQHNSSSVLPTDNSFNSFDYADPYSAHPNPSYLNQEARPDRLVHYNGIHTFESNVRRHSTGQNQFNLAPYALTPARDPYPLRPV